MLVVDQEYVDKLRNKYKKKPRLSSLYGMDRLFKLLYNIPFYVPVDKICLLEHGVSFQFSHFYQRLKDSKNELIFLDNTHRTREFEIQTGKIGYPISPLYPKYRQLKNIFPKENRKGTLAFPSHSSSEFDFSQGYKKYAEDLLKLPDKYHPITICMYYFDLLKNRHLIFEEVGFNIITNGYVGDPEFPDRLYDHLSSFEYITSNHEGSYVFYALELGIPFFLYGEGISKKFSEIGEINGINMKEFMSDKFLNNFSNLLKFDLNEEVRITNQLKECVNYIIDDKNALSIDAVHKLVMKNWLHLLYLKTKFLVLSIFNNSETKVDG